MSLPDGYPLLVGGTYHHSWGGGPKEAGQKIQTCFSIPAIRCETFPGQGYTIPPAPKSLTRGRFISNDLTYQDIQWQPLLMTMAYACTLQYWAEWANLPVNPDHCPLAMRIIKLMWQVRGHITFYKWDIFQNLERVALETADRDPAAPRGTPSPSLPQSNQFPCPLWLMLTIYHLAPQMLLAPLEQWPELSPPPDCWAGRPSCPVRPNWRRKAVCADCNHLGKKTRSGYDWGYSWRNCDHLGRRIGLQEPPNGGSFSWTHQGEEGGGTPKCHHRGSHRKGPGERLIVENIMDLPIEGDNNHL